MYETIAELYELQAKVERLHELSANLAGDKLDLGLEVERLKGLVGEAVWDAGVKAQQIERLRECLVHIIAISCIGTPDEISEAAQNGLNGS